MMKGLTVSVVMVLVFLLVDSTIPMGLSSRTEWFALLELRSSMGIGEKDWPRKAEPCRNWTGVQCRNGRVVGINVAGVRRTRLDLLIPSFEEDALANLTLLDSFNASGFMLSGSIPEWFGVRLVALQVLDLRSCSISGLIPGSLGGLSRLKSLFLSGNDLTGRVPSSLGLLSLLSVLDLSGNFLSGKVPDSFSKLGNLTKLDLSNNYLSGSIPPELGALPNLQSLNLSDNNFTDLVPIQLGNLSKLVELDISMNSLFGRLPGSLFSSSLVELQVLDLSGNFLSGSVPDSFSKLGNLTKLDLSNNYLSGSIPPELGALPNLQSLNLSDNNFTDLVPTQLGNLSKLVELDLSMNYLSERLPGSLFSSSLVELQVLDLSGNFLSGSVPDSFSKLGNLTKLDLSDNYLSGSIPPEVGALPKLQSLNLSFNTFTDLVPTQLGNLSKLVELYLSMNSLFGRLPGSLFSSSLVELQVLDLSGNFLSGSVPNSFSKLGNLTKLDLSNNYLSGLIPPELGALPNLQSLNLSVNNFTDLVPTQLGNLSKLVELDLSMNWLFGRLPGSLFSSNLVELQVLDLFGNCLSGSVPDSFSKLGNLTKLDLSDNYLSGSIPPEVGALPNLQSLNLSFNNFTDLVPTQLGNLSKLVELDLRMNSLSGRLPGSLFSSSLVELQVLDLSGNFLSGSVLDSFSKLGNLTKLDLSNNYLSGSIPPEVGALPNLQSLNLSDNTFTDLVPTQLGNLSKLVELDLSMNSLSGRLPGSLFSSSLVELQVLILSRNSIGGALPDALWSMPSLHFFDVSGNNLTGLLPKLSDLNVSSTGAAFNLSNNLFYGPVNGLLNKYKMIDLSGNYLEGEVQVGGLSNVTLARNCIQMISNQRGLQECRLFYVQRNLSFAEAPFPESSESEKNRRLIFILAGVLGGLGFIVLLVLVLIYIFSKSGTKCGRSDPCIRTGILRVFICIYSRVRKPRKKFQNEDEDDEIEISESLQFTFETIRNATNDFSDSNKLGHGGFGAVYSGRLSDGQDIAVKRLSRDSGQGDLEFKNEVLLVAKLQHRNLVRLLGFGLEGRERLLVYEYVANKSLDYFIFDQTKRTQLNWETRYKIIAGIARGILYLHEDSRLRIIHRDLKASNVLLDEKMNPKIADFGMARLFGAGQTQENTNRIVGTYGYMAPEYAMHGQFSVKSDVFSFGVLVLEMVSGHKSSGVRCGDNIEYLLSFVWRNWREGSTTNIIDDTLNNDSVNEIMRCIHIGLLCVQENAASRPTMASVVLMLNSPYLALSVPSEPAFYVDSGTENLQDMMQSWDYNTLTQESINEASITEPFPR